MDRPYLEQHFPVRSESESWILLGRGSAAPATDDKLPAPEVLSASRKLGSRKGLLISVAPFAP
jgi:hypothetical protein